MGLDLPLPPLLRLPLLTCFWQHFWGSLKHLWADEPPEAVASPRAGASGSHSCEPPCATFHPSHFFIPAENIQKLESLEQN